MTDTARRNLTEERLLASEERMRLAQAAADLGIFDYDPASGAIHWDERTRLMWDLAPDESADYSTFLARIHPDDREEFKVAIAAALNPNGSGRFHAGFRVVAKNGQRRDILSTGSAFFRDTNAVRFIGTVQDVTTRTRMEHEVKERRVAMEVLGKHEVAAQTAAAIAHDLNQPLVAVSAYAEVALRAYRENGGDSETLTHALEGCVKQANRAGRILSELLDFLHDRDTEAAPFDLNEVIGEAVAIVKSEMYEGFHSVLKLDPNLPAVLGNRVQVGKVVVNLVHNGLEAMRAASVDTAAITILVRSAASREMAQVTVRDEGPGISDEAAKRVFLPFFTTKEHGIGLGLAISRALIEAHGGQLWVDPSDGPGATFHFTLPFANG